MIFWSLYYYSGKSIHAYKCVYLKFCPNSGKTIFDSNFSEDLFAGDGGGFVCYISNKYGEEIKRSVLSFIPVVPVMGKL